MGCASALALAERGVSVTVLERAIPGAEASTAAAGILGAQSESHEPGPLVDLLISSRALYPEWVKKLTNDGALSVGYVRSGVLRLALTEHEAADLERTATWQEAANLRVVRLDRAGASKLEPASNGEIASALFFPDDAQVDPPLLLRALVAALAREGVQTRSGAMVKKIAISGGRATGVLLEDGELSADAVVLAAGSWSALVPGASLRASLVKPIRGQVVQLEERPPQLRTIVMAGATYVVPRGDGRVVCGSTMEAVGFQKEVTAAGVAAILEGAITAVPSLGAAAFVTAWSNFRPFAGDAMPLVGTTEVPGLFLATGHHRNGILLAPWTAREVANAVTRANG